MYATPRWFESARKSGCRQSSADWLRIAAESNQSSDKRTGGILRHEARGACRKNNPPHRRRQEGRFADAIIPSSGRRIAGRGKQERRPSHKHGHSLSDVLHEGLDLARPFAPPELAGVLAVFASGVSGREKILIAGAYLVQLPLRHHMATPIAARLGDLDPTQRDCNICGHPWTEHVLYSNLRPATEGWIECPVSGCTCHCTWSLPPEQAAQIRAHLAPSGGGLEA